MEIEITEFCKQEDPFFYSASASEMGQDAGRVTWNNALNCSLMLLDSQEKQEAFKEWVKGFGSWDDKEISGWDSNETNALFVQFISGNMRDMGVDECMPDDFDWQEYEKDCEDGRVSSEIFQAEDGKIYFSLCR